MLDVSLRTGLRAGSLVAIIAAVTGCAASSEDEESTESASSAQTNPNDPRWDCYAPEPGHPTAAEKSAFLTTSAVAAQEAERTYGVPAAAILAMAAVEGGYGFTRTALFAKNAFGYKFGSTATAGGRGAYTLGCQPSWDVGNRYIVFSSIRDGILFVSQRLATRADWANYKGPTDRYRAARNAGANVTTAVNAWIDGIADAGYNYDPPTYKRTIKSMIAANGLYAYSGAVAPGGSTSPPAGGGSAPTSTWVSIDAPAADAYVSGSVALRASASSGVTKVVFVSVTESSEYVIGAASVPPFSAQWSTAGWVPNGAYAIRFEAYSGATMVASASRRVHVAN